MQSNGESEAVIMSVVLVLGGARSGKTGFAERLASNLARENSLPVTYIATGQAIDSEMEQRIDRHRAQRPEEWRTVEEPCDLPRVLESSPPQSQVYLIDCLSLLLNNWMFEHQDAFTESVFLHKQEMLLSALSAARNPVVIVSNEVGAGIVPGDPLSRQYRDYLGWLNQSIASVSEQVYWVVAGLATELKGEQARLD